ncbi:MAG: hypothetical protein JSW43_00950 [Gemmatimonadota bacterium]|nr:MAG: hypothetical protein JSW43_00950 [Gemmatimonadota bacterium]
MRRVTCALAATAALALAACEGDQIIDGEIASVTVYGSVTNAASEPIDGAVLRFWIFWTFEDGPPYASDTADASGAYHAQLTTWGSRTVVDLRIIAEGPEESGFRPDTVLREGVVLNGGDVPDSVRVDFVLQPAP